MLCNSKTSHRPDKLLQNRLVSLAYSLVFMTLTLVLFLFYPEYTLYTSVALLILGFYSLILTLKTISAGEEAISYGGFANEIIKKNNAAVRIENVFSEAVIENDLAKSLFGQQPIISFLVQHMPDSKANKASVFRLQTACENLISEKVILSIHSQNENNKIFTEEKWLEISVHPIYLKKTDIFESKYSVKAIKKDTYLLWTCKDISAEKNMEQIFHEERKSLHDFIDFMPVGLYVTDSEYTLEYVNHAFASILKNKREELIGKKLTEMLSPVSILPDNEPIWHQKVYFLRPENEVHETYVFQENYRENQKIKMHGVVIDNLPNDNTLKNDLNLAYDKINWLFNKAPVGIIFADPDGQIKACNTTSEKFLNIEQSQLIAQSIYDQIKAEDVEKFKKLFAEINTKNKTSASIDVHLQNKDKVAMIYLTPMEKYHSSEDAQNKGVILYLIDATEQKSLEQQFAQAQKMQAVGQLAGGVAHDFNNLLTAIIGFCDLVMQKHGIGDPSFEDLRQIKDNATRAAGLVRQLLAFSRKQPLKPKLIDITEHLTKSSQMVKPVLGEQISLKFYHGKNLGFVRVDPTQFSQVIINLAINARDAMNGHGTIFINTRVEKLTEPYPFGDEFVKPGEFVVIDVKDTGCGISPENINRIFDPFFSTKQNVVGSGTGLGLATVYGIVRQTEGFIKVESQVGEGTTFSIYLPRFEKDIEPEKEHEQPKNNINTPNGLPILTVKETINSPINVNEKMIFGLNVSMIDRGLNPTDPQAGSIRILFVEDEDSVRTFAVRALKKKGYDIISCNSSENALEHLEKDDKFDLLLTDMMLPGISGAELASIVKKRIPDIKIIIASGYSEEMAKQGISNSADFEFIAKPYSLGNLTKKVFDVLNKQ